jgi:small subunit ribosomal protein S1
MANVLNPETESITLNTEIETPTLEPATELEQFARIDQPLPESTSTPETAEIPETPVLDADAPTAELPQEAAPEPSSPGAPPVVQAQAAQAPPAEIESPQPVAQAQAEPAPPAELESPEDESKYPDFDSEPEPVAPASHAFESPDDFSAALAAFEREQAAEAAAVEAYGDKVVQGTVLKQTEKHLVVDVGLKSEGLVPLEQVTDHTGAVKFQPGDVIDVVIEREEPEGGYLVSYERAQRLRVWDTIEKAANDKTPVMGTVVSRVKGGLTVDIGLKAFLPGSQLEIRPVRNLDGYLGQQIEVRVIKLNKKRGNVVVSR